MDIDASTLSIQALVVLVPLVAGVVCTLSGGAHPIAYWVARFCFIGIAADLTIYPAYEVLNGGAPNSIWFVPLLLWFGFIFAGAYSALSWIDRQAWINSPFLKPDNRPAPFPPPDLSEDFMGLSFARPVSINPLFVYFGTCIGVSSHMPHTILQMHDEPMLTVDRDKRGNLIIQTLKIFDANDDIVIWFDNHKYRMGPTAMRPERPDPHSIVVHDRTATEVLNLRFLNSQTLLLTGLFRYKGRSAQVFDDHVQIGTLRMVKGFFFENRADIIVGGEVGGGGIAVG